MSFRGGQRSFLNLLFEVALIAVGVFFALWANNWHEDREHRAQAKAALRNFASEMEANRQATQRNRAYHEAFARELREFLASKEPASENRLDKSVLRRHAPGDLRTHRMGPGVSHPSLILP